MLRTAADAKRSWLGVGPWLGPWLAKLRLHAIEACQAPGQPPTIAKRRRWLGSLLIGPGNLYLRLLRSGVRVLPMADWQARERAVHRALHGIEPQIGHRGWLILPRWPGVVLADYARNPRAPAPARLRGLSSASRALGDLHRLELPRADGGCEHFSHGDATLRNVLFDPETGLARWFDFDMAHDAGLAPAWRHGDDLRALVYSAVESFSDMPVALVLRTVRDTYAHPGPWEQLRNGLARGPLHRSPLHFAQACPPEARRRELESLLLRGAWPDIPIPIQTSDPRTPV